MSTSENLRNSLIDKILTIKNKEFLIALDKLITSNAKNSDLVELTSDQKAMLNMSENDIENGRLISQDAMNKRNTEWLNGL